MLTRFGFILIIMSVLTKISSTEDEVESEYFSKCFEEIGCLDMDERWYNKKLRPVNLQPLERHIIKTDFLLMKPGTEEDTENGDNLLYNSVTARYDAIQAAGFNKSSDLMILIHDFTSNGYTGWIKHLARAIFQESLDFNVISVDWQRGAEAPYDQAIANARVVALEVINLIKELKQTIDYSLDNIHIIGHGVGAHIAGYVGMSYNDIRKVTGLDPSGPRFEGMPDIVKLDPSDAKYVEVIHTDAFNDRSQGTKEVMGHSDFFVNNAELQPGCTENTTYPFLVDVDKNSLANGEVLPGCSHKRSFKYFIESLINSRCTFLGIQCTNYDNFTNGLCTACGTDKEFCRTFGTKTYGGSVKKTMFFLNSGQTEPYCMFQYKISVSLMQEASLHNGYFDFILVDDVGNVVEVSPSYKPHFKNISSNSNNTFVYYGLPPQLLTVKEAKVRWNEEKKLFCIIYCEQYINVIKIEILPIGVSKNKSSSSTLCPLKGESRIDNGDYKKFTRCIGTTENHSHTKQITKTTLTTTITSEINSKKKGTTESIITTTLTSVINSKEKETTETIITKSSITEKETTIPHVTTSAIQPITTIESTIAPIATTESVTAHFISTSESGCNNEDNETTFTDDVTCQMRRKHRFAITSTETFLAAKYPSSEIYKFGLRKRKLKQFKRSNHHKQRYENPLWRHNILY